MADNTLNQVWLTYALEEEAVPHALTLYFSLKRLLTSHKVGVIVSTQICQTSREILHKSFDFYVALDETWNFKNIPIQTFVKVFPFTLKPFEKIVLLAPTMLVRGDLCF